MRKAIFFDSIPGDPERAKESAPQGVTVMGATVYGAELIRALMQYGTYDTIYFPERGRPPLNDIRDSDELHVHSDRVRYLSEHQLSDLARYDQVALVALGIDFSDLLRIRKLSRCDAPVTGVTHSLNNSRQVNLLLLLLVSGLRNYDAIVCSSSSGRQALRKLFDVVESRLSRFGVDNLKFPLMTPVIPLGVDSDAFAPPSQRETGFLEGLSGEVLLYFGRFSSESKGDLFPLLVAFRSLLQRRPSTWLFLAGDDTEMKLTEALRQVAGELGVLSRVKIVPNPSREQKLELYKAADVFVTLSDNIQETFGITVIEAMASGLPVIASDWNGYGDSVADGETGLLVPTLLPQFPREFDLRRGTGSMDSPNLLSASTVIDLEAFVVQALNLLDNKELRLKMGKNAQLKVQTQYDWRVVVRQYEELWDLLNGEARLRSSPISDVSLDLGNYSYLEVFGHYPTELLAENRRVCLGPNADKLIGLASLWAQMERPEGWFSRMRASAVVKYLRSRDSACISEILDSCAIDEDERMLLLSQICRLWKYGIVQSVAATIAGEDREPAMITRERKQ